MTPLDPVDENVVVRSRFTLPRLSPVIRQHATKDPALKSVVERVDRIVITLEGILRKFQSYDTTLVAGVPAGNVVSELGGALGQISTLFMLIGSLTDRVDLIDLILIDLEDRVAALEEGGGGGANLCDIVWTDTLDLVLSDELCVVITSGS